MLALVLKTSLILKTLKSVLIQMMNFPPGELIKFCFEFISWIKMLIFLI